MGVLSWIVVGLVVGAIARLLVRGPHALGCIGTIALGILGSIVGGTVINVLTGQGFDVAPSGFFGSVLGAVLVLVAARIFGGGAKRPGILER